MLHRSLFVEIIKRLQTLFDKLIHQIYKIRSRKIFAAVARKNLHAAVGFATHQFTQTKIPNLDLNQNSG
jgi:hypothetical protein